MSTWRIAESLEVLRKQLNDAFPRRSKVSDGGIGDAAHASRSSDHNPWLKDSKGKGIVTARDFTHDPKTGIDCNWLADTLVKNEDPRIKYIIWNKQIFNFEKSPEWRPYHGINAHQHHLHLSVRSDAKLYDSTKEWQLDFSEDDADDVARVEPVSAATSSTIPLQLTDDHFKAGENKSDELPPSNINVEHADKVINEPTPVPPKDNPVTVKVERVSIWAKLGAGFAALTGLGINISNVIETKLNEINLVQLGYVMGGIALIALALWAYDRAQTRAHEKTLAKVDTASDPAKNTVTLER